MKTPDTGILLRSRPLLPLQQSMAIALHLSGTDGVDLEQLVWRMDRPIAAAALAAAFNAAAARHEALRVSFSLAAGEPAQAPHFEVAARLREIVQPTDEAWRESAL